MSLQVGIFLFSHHGRDDDAWKVAETINTSFNHNAPFTFFLTGQTLESVARVRGDVVSRIRWDAANKLVGWNPYKVEIGISTDNHMPVSQPGLPLDCWGAYYEGFVRPQIRQAKEKLERIYYRTPRGFFPPEGMFSPAFVYLLRQEGIDYSVMTGEFLGDDSWAKGQVYHQTPKFNIGDTKIVVTANELWPEKVYEMGAWNFKEAIKYFACCSGIERVVLGADINLFAGKSRGLSLEQGNNLMLDLFYRLKEDGCIDFRNVASVADNYWCPRDICCLHSEHRIADPSHYISSWMDEIGSLELLDSEVNGRVNDFIKQHTHLLRIGKGCQKMQDAKHTFFDVSGMEFRHRDWNSPLRGRFDWEYSIAKRMLDEVEAGYCY